MNGVYDASYTPAGALQQLSLGNGITEQTCYNDRQQPFVIRQRFAGPTLCSNTGDANDMGYLRFTFPGGNNGNVSSQTTQYGATPYGANPVYPALSFTQNYTYDQANRLASVQETSSANWSQYFGYDALGNRWLYSGAQFDASTPVTGSIDPFDANNHLNSAGYDARGNQTGDGGYAFQYDEEGRLTSSSMSGSTLATYTYDADGHRVTKVAGAETTTYVYNPQGELAAEYTTGATTTPCATTCYLMTDHLGSTRMQTDVSGNQIQLFDYAPFGEMLGTSTGGRDDRWGGNLQGGIHFTGKEQEGYEGAYMHYFGARYFSGGLGRWTAADPDNFDARLGLPQSWNMYGYAWNNPLSFQDEDGRWVNVAIGAGVGFATGFLGSAVSQALANGRVDWLTATKVGAVGAGTGALAGATFGVSLVAQAASSIAVGTGAGILNGALTRAVTGGDAFDRDAIVEDAEVSAVTAGFGASIRFVGMVVNLPVRPTVPSPLGNVVTGLKRLARLKTWSELRTSLGDKYGNIGGTVGALIGNFGAQVKQGWDIRETLEAERWMQQYRLLHRACVTAPAIGGGWETNCTY